MKNYNCSLKKIKGFTISELIVVIFIISILASIIIVDLPKVRNKAKDARIVEDMRQLLNLAQREINRKGRFTVLPSQIPEMKSLIDDIEQYGGQCSGGIKNSICFYSNPPNFNEFCAKTKLNLGNWWCIDSNLTSKKYSNNPICGSKDINDNIILTCD